MRKKLFLDMDGVLVDFVTGVRVFHSKHIEYKDIQQNIAQQMFPSNEQYRFYDPLGFDFWANLTWTEEGQKLLAGLLGFIDSEDIVLMTSPILTRGCADGKLAWIKKNCPIFTRQYCVTPCKHQYAHPSALLVDDSERNCTEFQDAGGFAYLVPRPWNNSDDLPVNELLKNIRYLWDTLEEDV